MISIACPIHVTYILYAYSVHAAFSGIDIIFMWQTLITELDTKSETISSSPATEDQIKVAEALLHISLPESLRSFLSEMDGLSDVYGLNIVWSINEIQLNNIHMRQDGLAAKTFVQYGMLLFFADAGNGDEYAFRVKEGQITQDDIFVWRHEDDRLEWVELSLEMYLRRLFSV